jgi:hypothetical protein
MNIVGALLVIVPVSLLAGVVASWRVQELVEWYPLPVKGAPARMLMVLMFFVGCFIFGLVAALLYAWLASIWPRMAPHIYLGMGAGLAVLFTIAGLIVRAILKRGALVAWTVQNFLWGLGYGVLLPVVLRG